MIGKLNIDRIAQSNLIFFGCLNFCIGLEVNQECFWIGPTSINSNLAWGNFNIFACLFSRVQTGYLIIERDIIRILSLSKQGANLPAITFKAGKTDWCIAVILNLPSCLSVDAIRPMTKRRRRRANLSASKQAEGAITGCVTALCMSPSPAWLW